MTLVKGAHVLDLRRALDAVYDSRNRPRPADTDPTLAAGEAIIKRVHVTEIRSAIRALE